MRVAAEGRGGEGELLYHCKRDTQYSNAARKEVRQLSVQLHSQGIRLSVYLVVHRQQLAANLLLGASRLQIYETATITRWRGGEGRGGEGVRRS